MTRFFASIRVKVVLAFFLIIGLSFLVMAGSLTNLLGRSLFDQQVRQDKAGLEKWAVRLAEPLAAADTQTLSPLVTQAAAELGGRVLLVDQDGKVQLDSFRDNLGQRLDYPEIASILVEGKSTDFGVHDIKSGDRLEQADAIRTARDDNWVSYGSASIVHGGQVLGVVLLISSVQAMMENLTQLQSRMLILFVVVAGTALGLGLIFSGVITKPIGALTKVIQRMARGELGARVAVRGSGEIKNLASTFNMMSERLETLELSRNEFVSNASHELKTPLATMKIMLESLIYQPDMPAGLRDEFLTDINQEIDRLSAIVGDLLTLVQADAHSMKLQREKISLAAVIKETVHRLTPLAEQKGQRLKLSINDSADMYADKDKLAQVAYNLIENAIKYTQNDGEVSITLTRQGQDAVMTVRDNGAGIAPEALGHVFDRFYRVDKARSRESGGTGLGLSIVQQLVSLHGGSVGVESEEGKGTTFTVVLPLTKG